MKNIKIKSGFILRKIVDQWVAVPLGERIVTLNEIAHLNETGAFLWQMLEQCTHEQALVDAMQTQYDIDNATATEDVREFIAELEAKDLLE